MGGFVMSKIRVDMYLLADATGSMASAIADVKNNLKSGSETLREENDWDVGIGVAWYRDTADGDRDIFDNVLGITTDLNKLNSALNEIKASGGGDTLEAQMYALYRLAKQKTISGWRENAYRYIAWFGDVGGHDPLVYRDVSYTKDKAITELNAKNIKVLAFNTTSANGLNHLNQASDIAKRTDGDYLSSVSQSGITRLMYDTIQRNLSAVPR